MQFKKFNAVQKKCLQYAFIIALVAVTFIGTILIGLQPAFFAKAEATTKSAKQEQLKIAVLSDTHYLSPDLIKDTADFTEHLNSDRKMFAEGDAFLTEMLNTIKKDAPDVLLISGDLTKDGEKESHIKFAEKLNAFKNSEMPNLHVYITNGNHDVNNSNGMNFNTADGKAVPAGRTTPKLFKEIYKDLTYSDKTIIATFNTSKDKISGGLSYVARPKAGFTIISIDSCKYSADNTDSGKDEHETSGAISEKLEKWICKQIASAKKRGDTVIGLQHHGYIPHFDMEPSLLPMYLVDDYERLSTTFADAGMQYVFTGHMHANDIACITTKNGNTLYDIETGSMLTYPSPSRTVTITRNTDNKKNITENVNIETHTNIGPITFINPVTKEEQTINNITEYGQSHGFSDNMLVTTIKGFAKDLLSTAKNTTITEETVEFLMTSLITSQDKSSSVYYNDNMLVINNMVKIGIEKTALTQAINAVLHNIDTQKLFSIFSEKMETLIPNLTSISVDNEKTLLDYINYIYQSHLGGLDNLDNAPDWVKNATEKVKDKTLLNEVLETIVPDINLLLNEILKTIPMKDLLGAETYNKAFIPVEGRKPLITVLDAQTQTMVAIALKSAGWKESNLNKQILVAPQGSNPNVGYSAFDFIDALLGNLDINSFLTDDLKETANDYLLNVVSSMGTDNNFVNDNNATITYEWKKPSNLAPLWISIGVIAGVVLILGVIGIIVYNKRKQKSTAQNQ